MTLEEIKQLIQLAQETGVAELEVQRAENRVRVKLMGAAYDFAVPTGAVMPAVTMAPPTARPAAAASTSVPVAGGPTDYTNDPSVVFVKSPIVGTFYEAPAPDTPPFVKVGDAITTGKVLCIIESMKLMNEIESELSGTIVAKLVQNGHAVEYGEALFAVRTT